MKIDDKIFLDRDPIYFAMVYNYLRCDGSINYHELDALTKDLFKKELEYWGIPFNPSHFTES